MLACMCRKLHLFLGKSTKTVATRDAVLIEHAQNRLSAVAWPQIPQVTLQQSPNLRLYLADLHVREGRGEKRMGKRIWGGSCPRNVTTLSDASENGGRLRYSAAYLSHVTSSLV